MKIAKALILSPLVPLVGIGVIGIGLGYRSILELGEYIFMWAIVIYPLVAALALGGYFISAKLDCRDWWHFGIGGFFTGAIVVFGWFGLVHFSQGGSPVLATINFCAVSGIVGAITSVVFWRIALSGRTA